MRHPSELDLILPVLLLAARHRKTISEPEPPKEYCSLCKMLIPPRPGTGCQVCRDKGAKP